MDIDLDTGKIDLPLIRIYETSFYNNYIANQIDFTFLNNTYQVFNGGSRLLQSRDQYADQVRDP